MQVNVEISGPQGSGKTLLALAIAKMLDGLDVTPGSVHPNGVQVKLSDADRKALAKYVGQ